MTKKSKTLIYKILWEMWWFGDFGTRKDWIEKLLKDLKEELDAK